MTTYADAKPRPPRRGPVDDMEPLARELLKVMVSAGYADVCESGPGAPVAMAWSLAEAFIVERDRCRQEEREAFNAEQAQHAWLRRVEARAKVLLHERVAANPGRLRGLDRSGYRAIHEQLKAEAEEQLRAEDTYEAQIKADAAARAEARAKALAGEG